MFHSLKIEVGEWEMMNSLKGKRSSVINVFYKSLTFQLHLGFSSEDAFASASPISAFIFNRKAKNEGLMSSIFYLMSYQLQPQPPPVLPLLAPEAPSL